MPILFSPSPLTKIIATPVASPATVSTGAEIQVPLFLETGTVVKVDTRDGRYLGRVSN